MASLSERLLKLRPKNASNSGPRSRVAQLQEQAKSIGRGSGSPSSSKNPASSDPTQIPVNELVAKRKCADNVASVPSEGDKISAGVFVLPPCYLNRDLFRDGDSLCLHKEEREAILTEDKELRRQHLAEYVAAVMRVLETDLSLNDESSSAQTALNAAYAKIHKLKVKNEKLKGNILNHESRFEDQFQLLKDLKEMRPQLETATRENERLVARNLELEGITVSVEDETKTEKNMATQADLIARIRLLEQDVIDTLGYSFNITVEQLKILNPWVELVVEGAGPFNQVVDGKILYPPDDSDGEYQV